jgi:Flp pilus assembly protein TadD
MTTLKLAALFALILVSGSCDARAGDILKISIPRHSELTPVQRLNREGVDAVNRRQYEKAGTLFYKAYLYDPADPFTLNNLGYISELKGELDRARNFYALASEQSSDANIDRSNVKQLEGKPMQYAFKNLQDLPMQVNRMNVSAMVLLSENRGAEAVSLLQKALSLDSQNPFTWNNLGVAEETSGDYDDALKSYVIAAGSRSLEPVVVTQDRTWRGKPVSAMAAASGARLEERMKKMASAEVSAVMFTLRGVSATNRNDLVSAKQDYLHAYALDPGSAFSLNNRGYVAEMEGDMETAQFFYGRALEARDSNARVGTATLHSAEGKRLFTIATDSDRQVDIELERYSQDRRQRTGPIELTPRNVAPDSGDGVTLDDSPSSVVPPAASPSAPQLH